MVNLAEPFGRKYQRGSCRKVRVEIRSYQAHRLAGWKQAKQIKVYAVRLGLRMGWYLANHSMNIGTAVGQASEEKVRRGGPFTLLHETT
jgi:hypothetical protein